MGRARSAAALFALLIFLRASVCLAGPGTTAADFLKVNVGAKAVAMGGTQFAAENDSFAQFYNPALLSGISQKEVGFMHNEFIEDLRQEVVTYVHPTRRRGNFFAAINLYDFGDIDGFDDKLTPTGDVAASDFMFGAGWGKKWSFGLRGKRVEDLSTGVTFKVIREKLGDDSALGFAFDAGLSYPFTAKYLKRLKFGVSLMNFGTGLKADSESIPIPKMVRLGLAYSRFSGALLVTADEVVEFEDEPYPSIGIQYLFRKIFAIRIGYKGKDSLDDNLTFGVGFENPLFRLDYALVPFDDLGDAHRISVVYRFGKNIRGSTADIQLREKVDQAQAFYAQGLLVDAYMIAVQVHRVAPWFTPNNKLLARIQKDFRDLEESDLREKLQMQVAAIFSRAEKFFEEGNLINARLELQAVLGLQPNHRAALGYMRQIEAQFRSFVQSFYRSGMIAFAEEDYRKAKNEFEKVIAIEPGHNPAREQLAKCNDILDKREKEAEEAEQKDTLAREYKAGLSAFIKERFVEALAHFKKVLEIDPDHIDAVRYAALAGETLYEMRIEEGRDLVTRGSWETAINVLKKALEHRPDSSEAKSLMDEAQKRWKIQKKVVSQNLYRKGLEAYLTDDKKKAKSIWKRALELDPDNEEARRSLDRLEK